MKRLLAYVRPYRISMVLGVIFVAACVMCAVINDVERVCPAVSESPVDVLRQTFVVVASVAVLLSADWRMTRGGAVLARRGPWPGAKLGRGSRHSVESSQPKWGQLD